MPAQTPSLRAFLDDPARPEGTLSYHELQGFLFAVLSAPEFIPPSEWLPIIFNDDEPGYASVIEAQAVLGQVMSLYNDINAGILREDAMLPDDCLIAPRAVDNLAETAPLSRWARGFALGHQWLEELWQVELTTEGDEEFGAVLMALSFFATRSLAESFTRETSPSGGRSLDDMAALILDMLPDAMASYAALGRVALAATQTPVSPAPRRVVKTGRNDLCPCGSGKKFKKCHGATPH